MKDNIMQSKSFYSHHSAWGSYSSFILGKIGHGGGFVNNNVQPPKTNLYIGYKIGGNKPKLMPFFTNIKYGIGEEAFMEKETDTTADWCKKNVVVFKENQINRIMKWATESWIAENLTMKIITPFCDIPEPGKLNKDDAKFYLCPATFIQLEFDNSKNNDEMIGLFAMQGIRKILSENTNKKLLGLANHNIYGLATEYNNSINENLSWNVVLSSFANDNKFYKLASEGGLSFKIPKGKKRTYTLALASYNENYVTTGIKSKFYYTKYFNSLEDVLSYALSNFDKYNKIAMEKDKLLDSFKINEHKKFMISHFTRSYIANTEFLIDEKNNPLFIVNEGEYQMMNTLDLTIDQIFWEMKYTPWTIKNELESYLKYQQYTDFVKYQNGENKKGEICFCHDQGVADMFSNIGYSSYEISNLTGTFSYMTHEQILNWLITASVYGLKMKDYAWIKKHSNIFIKLLNSIIIRDENNDGIMDKDSSRCESGSEITTYDSLDESLGQARNNLYLAVKTWAGYICLENIFKILNKTDLTKKAIERSQLCASTIISKYNKKLGYIPAVFEKNNKSKIIPAIEALIYPYIINDMDAVSENGRFKDLIKTLKIHIENILIPGSCINKNSGGWQLSSTSKNSWMSKIAINQFVAEKILKIKTKDWEKWDKIHASWQQIGCSYFAATDQIDCNNGKDMGSRLYPRLVSTYIWIMH